MKNHGLIALSDIAKDLKISRQGVYLRILRNKIPYERLGGIAVIRKEHLPQVLKSNGKGRPSKRKKEIT